MAKFESGDRVIMKEEVTGEDVQKFGIDGSEIKKIKEKILIVDNAWIDEDGIDVVDFKDTKYGFIWKSEWFKYVSLIPDELFEI